MDLTSLQGFGVGFVGRWSWFARDAVSFGRPLAQVDEAAALAAEWSEAVVFAPLHFFAAVRAVYRIDFVIHELLR